MLSSTELISKQKLATRKSFKAEISSVSPLSEQELRANALNVSFETLNGGQFMLSTQIDDDTTLPLYKVDLVPSNQRVDDATQ